MGMKYRALSASDKTDDWPYWYITDETGINITVKIFPELRGWLPFTHKLIAIQKVHELNGK